MPSWSIHLAVAKKVNNKLKLQKDLFYMGNLIADVDYNNKLKRKNTHYYNKPCKNCPDEILPDVSLFLKDYKTKLNDSLILGYFVHILTDYYYNNYIFTNNWVYIDNEFVGIKLKNNKILKSKDIDRSLRKQYKHYDLDLYGKSLFKLGNVEIPNYDIKIDKSLVLLKDNFFTLEDYNNRLNYLKDNFIKFNKIIIKEKLFGYKLYTKEELDDLFNNCVNFILEEIKKI